MIVMKCPGCKTRFEFADDLGGKKIRCKSCGDIFRVESPTAESTSPKPSKGASRPAVAEDDDRPPVKSRRHEDDDRPAVKSRRRDHDDDDDRDDRRGRRDESDDELPRRKKVNPLLIVGPILGVVVVAVAIFLLVRGLGKKKGLDSDGEVAKGVAKVITLDVPAKDISQLVVPDGGNQFGLLRNDSPEPSRRRWIYEPYDLAAGRRVGKVALPEVKDPAAVTVSPDGKLLLVTEKSGFGEHDRSLVVYSIADGKCLTRKVAAFPRDDKRPFDSPALFKAEFVGNDRVPHGRDEPSRITCTQLPSFDVERSEKLRSSGEPLGRVFGQVPGSRAARWQVAFSADRKWPSGTARAIRSLMPRI